MSEKSIMPDHWQSVVPMFYGYEPREMGHSWGPTIRGHYLLHYIFEGCGTIEKNGKVYTAGKDDIFVIAPDDLTTYAASKDDPWAYCWLAFRAEGALPGLDKTVISAPFARGIFRSLRESLEADVSNSRIYALTYELLWLLSQEEATTVSRNYAAYAKIHLENTYVTAVTIESIAETLHIDRRHLTAVFRKAYGITPQQYLMELRLVKAKEFLSLGYSVTDAAAMAGFSDLSNFSKKYKQHYGITPRQQKASE